MSNFKPNWLQLIDSREKTLPGQAYKLYGDNPSAAQFAMDVAFSDNLDIDEQAMSIVIPFVDGRRRDGVGDLLEVGGIKTERHQANPIVGFDHFKKYEFPIAMAEDPKTKEYSVWLDPVTQQGRLKAFFYQGGKGLGDLELKNNRSAMYDHAVFCEQLFDLAAKRFIRGGSIGYQVIHAKQLNPDYETGTPAGLHLLSVLMLEGSLVVLPANQDTVRKAMCLGTVCGKPMSPILYKSFSAYAPEKKVLMGYEGKALKNKTVQVPLKNVREPNQVPPARFYSGVRKIETQYAKNIKALRKKYKKGIGSRIRDAVAGGAIALASTMGAGAKPVPPTPPKPQIQNVQPDSGNAHHREVRDELTKLDQKALPISATIRQSSTFLKPTEQGLRKRKRKDMSWLAAGKGSELVGLNKKRRIKNLRQKYKAVDKHEAAGEPEKERETYKADKLCHIRGRVVEPHWVCPATGERFCTEEGARSCITTGGKALKGIKSFDLSAVRDKYRKNANAKFSRRLKKSISGKVSIFVKGKDLESVRGMAKECGVRVDHKGTKDGWEKLHLVGDDNVLSEIARKYGRRLLGRGTKSLGGNLMPTKTKQIPRKTKAMPPDAPVNDPPLEEPGPGPSPDANMDLNVDGEVDQQEVEKYSAQVIRRMHQDAILLLQDYEGLREHLEHPQIDGHMEKKLQLLVSELEELEGLMEAHHPEADPLAGGAADLGLGEGLETEEVEEENPIPGDEAESEEAETNEEVTEPEADEEPVEADSKPKKEVDEADAWEGSKKEKALLARKRVKAIRKSYGKDMNGMDGGMGDGSEDEQMKALAFYRKSKGLCGKCGKKGCSCGMKSMCTKCGKKDCSCKSMGKKDLEPKLGHIGKFPALHPHEHEHVKNARGFLQKLESVHQLDPPVQMESFHHGQCLSIVADRIQKDFGVSEHGVEQPGTEAKRDEFTGVKDMPGENRNDAEIVGSENWMQQEAGEPEHGGSGGEMEQYHKKLMDHSDKIKRAASHLHEIAQMRNPDDVTDEHRARSAEHGANLEHVLSEHEAMGKERGAEEDHEPQPGIDPLPEVHSNLVDPTGEIQEKQLVEQRKQIEELNNQFKDLLSLIKR